MIEKRDRQGKESEVYIDGRLQSREKVRKEIARYNLSRSRQLSPSMSLRVHSQMSYKLKVSKLRAEIFPKALQFGLLS